jgi:hypothetical protein
LFIQLLELRIPIILIFRNMIYYSNLIFQFFDYTIKLTKHQINDVDLENLAVKFLLFNEIITKKAL